MLEEAGIDLQALRSNKAIFQNGMNPSAVMLMDENSKREDAQAMTDMLKQSHTGAANQHKIVALSKTKDFKPWTMTNRDLEYLKLRDLATSKVTTAYRIPKVLLGHHNAGDYATTKFLIRDTYNHVYRPMQRIIEAIITERLVHRFNQELRFELLTPDASDPDDIRKDQMQAKRDGILLADEVRGDSFGKDPLEAKDTKDNPTKDEQKPDREAGDTAEDAPDASKSIRKALTEDQATTLADSRAGEMDSLAESVDANVLAYFTDQQARYLAGLPEGLSGDEVDGYVDSSVTEDDGALFAVLLGAIATSLTAGSQAAQLQIGISLGFNQTNPFVQDYLSTQSLQHVKGINQTTRDQLRATLKTGISNEESIDQLRTRIQAVFTNASDVRANTIARTETAQAFEYANHEVLQQMFEQGVINARQWLTAQDDRVRPTHAELHGYIVRFGNQYPGGIEPGSEINCRCTEIGVKVEPEELS